MNVESIKDLKKVLRDVGYSGKAIDEILKWYKSEKTTDDRK